MRHGGFLCIAGYGIALFGCFALALDDSVKDAVVVFGFATVLVLGGIAEFLYNILRELQNARNTSEQRNEAYPPEHA
ncbi:MAG TPA: hypothetical protein VFL85_05515 [Candidatus Saccharimonadales bacterium]|nr:hypothetical protein [Candidatus Saccharimonadales bacterium]